VDLLAGALGRLQNTERINDTKADSLTSSEAENQWELKMKSKGEDEPILIDKARVLGG
jgi:hypothetical protein